MESFYWRLMGVFLALDLIVGQLVNVALHKPAKFIDYPTEPHYAARALDGNTSPNQNEDESCVLSKGEHNNWWAVDLLFTYDIFTLQIANRKTRLNRLKQFYVYVSMVDPFPIPGDDGTFQGQLCLYYDGASLQPGFQPLYCDQPVRGRYVYIWKPETGCLTFCELAILVAEQKNPMELILVPGHVVGVLPVHEQTVRRSSPLECIHVCLTRSPQTPTETTTHVQINEKTGQCQCIQYSPLMTPPGIWALGGDFKTYKRFDDLI